MIIGCGCSWTYGFYFDRKMFKIMPRLKNYIDYLSEYYSVNVINFSKPGCTNYCIIKQIEHAISLKPSLIVFNTTTENRVDFVNNYEKNLESSPKLTDFDYYNNTEFNYTSLEKLNLKFNNIIHSSVYPTVLKKNRILPLEYENCLLKYSDPMIQKDKDKYLILGIINKLESCNIQYICLDYVNLFEPKSVNHVISIDRHQMFLEYPLINDRQHFNESGHEHIAVMLSNYIKNNSIKI